MRSRLAVLHWTMAVAFAFSTLLQWNDPDPLPWMAIYGAACAISVWAALGRGLPAWAPLMVGVIAAAWAAWIGRQVWGGVRIAELFASWEMKDARVEIARETGGLAIVALWMAVTAWGARRRPGSAGAGGGGTKS